jgi:hypothetical protein
MTNRIVPVGMGLFADAVVQGPLAPPLVAPPPAAPPLLGAGVGLAHAAKTTVVAANAESEVYIFFITFFLHPYKKLKCANANINYDLAYTILSLFLYVC